MDNAGPAGWGAKLEGHLFDLEDWSDALQKPFSPWIARVAREGGDLFILRSADLDVLATALEVYERAVPMVERLNGALQLAIGGQPVRCAAAAKIDELGQVTAHHVFAVGAAHGRSRGSAALIFSGPDGVVSPPPPPVRSAPQKWLDASEANDDIADLLAHLARADNWYDLYKAIELAQALVGGEAALLKFLGDEGKAFKLLKVTANFHRHARGQTYKPSDLATLSEARAGVNSALRRLLDHLIPS